MQRPWVLEPLSEGVFWRLAGVAYAATGPSAVLAFGLNGVIAFITALSFAELSTAFPQSGGTYLFAKRVLSVGAAFNVGWVAWFASIVAAALYALGLRGLRPGRMRGALAGVRCAVRRQTGACPTGSARHPALHAFLCRSGGTGANWINILKVVAFSVLIVGGSGPGTATTPRPCSVCVPS
jgi:APA family basic amino acid/polyamine antiporter